MTNRREFLKLGAMATLGLGVVKLKPVPAFEAGEWVDVWNCHNGKKVSWVASGKVTRIATLSSERGSDNIYTVYFDEPLEGGWTHTITAEHQLSKAKIRIGDFYHMKRDPQDIRRLIMIDRECYYSIDSDGRLRINTRVLQEIAIKDSGPNYFPTAWEALDKINKELA